MNLRDYFNSQKSVHLEPADKVALYETITQKTHTPVSIFVRMSFYTKLALYTFIGMVFLASLYVPYFSSFFHQTDGVITSSLGGATVQADYIAQIIETKGDIAIYNNGERVESKLFRAGDRLVLPAGAEIVFHISRIAQAKVTGPAEFFIEKNDQGYTIQLISGKYAEIQSLEDGQSTEKQAVGLRSSRVSIVPKSAEKMHFTYTEEGQKAVIDNQGDAALMVAKIENTEDQEVLAEHTMAELGSGSEILDELTGSITTGERMSPVQVAKALNDAHDEEGKKMVAGEQHENIKAILASEFLANDLQQITSTYLKGEAREYEIAYINLYNKINQIYVLMDIAVPQNISDVRSTVSLKVMISLIENLLYEMDNNFYVAQTHQARLKKLLGWLYALREKGFGSQHDTTLSGTALLETLNLNDYSDLLGK